MKLDRLLFDVGTSCYKLKRQKMNNPILYWINIIIKQEVSLKKTDSLNLNRLPDTCIHNLTCQQQMAFKFIVGKGEIAVSFFSHLYFENL